MNKRMIVVMAFVVSAVAVCSHAGDAWVKVRGPSSNVIVNYSRETFCWQVYATDQSTGDLYKQGLNAHRDQWTKIGGPGKEFVSDNTHLYGLTPDGSSIRRYKGVPMQWEQIGGVAKHIYAGGNKLFATNPSTGDIYKYNGPGVPWTKVGGPGEMFAVDDRGELYALSPGGTSVRRYKGTPMQWEKIGDAAEHIYAGGNKLYAKNSNPGDIYQYNGPGAGWTKVGGPAEMFVVDDEGHLYASSPGGSAVWRYQGTPMQWKKIGGPATKICAGGAGHVYAISPHTDNLWHYLANPFGRPYYDVGPATGARKVLIILWDPHRPTDPAPSKSTVENLICGPKPSVANYFWENSGGRFWMECVGVLGWYDADKPASHYWGPSDPQDLNNDGWIHPHVEKWAEAIRKADQQFDFKAYDTNGDKVLSPDELGIQIVIPQNGPFGTNRVAAGSEHPYESLVVDDVEIGWISEAYIGSPPSMGLVAHELCHLLLGATDMYVYYFQPYAPENYSIMDDAPANPPHLDPFHKLKLGWVVPRIVTSSGWHRIRDIETDHEVLILDDPDREDREYYIIENRWPGNSYDKYLPDAGLAVWHIMEDPAVFNTLPTPPKVDAQQWNAPEWQGWGRRAVRMIRPIYGPPYNTSLWDGADPQTGYNLLSVDSNPNHVTLKWANGTPSGFSVESIPTASAEMEIYIGVK